MFSVYAATSCAGEGPSRLAYGQFDGLPQEAAGSLLTSLEQESAAVSFPGRISRVSLTKELLHNWYSSRLRLLFWRSPGGFVFNAFFLGFSAWKVGEAKLVLNCFQMYQA